MIWVKNYKKNGRKVLEPFGVKFGVLGIMFWNLHIYALAAHNDQPLSLNGQLLWLDYTRPNYLNLIVDCCNSSGWPLEQDIQTLEF